MLKGIFLALFFAPVSGVFAESWTCQQGELVRHVLTFYSNSPERLPCKVFYSKPNENVMPRTLWQAQNTENFCETKAAAFVEKLESWGWQCTVDGQVPGRDGTGQGDDS